MTKDILTNVGSKDLSKQLSELAGIEASKKKCNDCANGGCVGQISNEYIKLECLTYPNFESPENFVKLLECFYTHNYTLLEESLNFPHYTGTFVANVLTGIKYELTNRSHNYKLGKLKQALQAAEWVY